MSHYVIADPKKCIGCRTCEIACVEAHSDKNIFLEEEEQGFTPRLKVIKTESVTTPVQCRQCKVAQCVKACPNESLTYDENGIIIVNEETCIGCKKCVVACPFGAMTMGPMYRDGKPVAQLLPKNTSGEVGRDELAYKGKIVATKCDTCKGRAGGPACMEKCPTGAFRIVEQ